MALMRFELYTLQKRRRTCSNSRLEEQREDGRTSCRLYREVTSELSMKLNVKRKRRRALRAALPLLRPSLILSRTQLYGGEAVQIQARYLPPPQQWKIKRNRSRSRRLPAATPPTTSSTTLPSTTSPKTRSLANTANSTSGYVLRASTIALTPPMRSNALATSC